jgi:F-type H+-transporting ATPase subunit a
MGDLFASFNPNTVIFRFNSRLNWVAISRVFFFPQIFWIQKSKRIVVLQMVIEYVTLELRVVFGLIVKPGTLLLFSSSFLFILIINCLGLTPYVFTPSSHLSFTLALALPLWAGYMILRLITQFNHNIGHLVPEGTPGALIPLMVVIESVRLVIRPFTLAVRLAANIIAGHLLLALLGGQGVTTRSFFLLPLIIRLSLLMLLECAVACIQAYVFMILSRLYLSEHNSKKTTLGDF